MTAQRQPEAVAVRSAGRAVTYADLRDLADRAGAGLVSAGIGHGDRLFVLSRSAPEILALLIGAAQVSAVVVPANWRLSPAELTAILDDSGARLVFADADLLHSWSPASQPTIDLSDWENWLPPKGTTIAAVDSALTAAALQIYTSGTSGQPKGVVLTHLNLSQKVLRMTSRWDMASDSRSLLATPLFHIGGLSWALVSLAAGAELVIPARATASDLRADIERHRITHAFLVPKLLTELVRISSGLGSTGSSLEVVLCGAAPVSVDLQREAARTLECRILQVYGMTETTGAITELDASAALTSEDPAAALHSAGSPYPWVELEIRDPETQHPLALGESGEIWTRSPQNCAGYWKRPAETGELLVDGWLRTGDGGRIDEHGRLHITDRIKDMIVSGGENIYSGEVEQALLQHPAVADAAVVGRPDPEWGEAVVAFVELNPGHQLELAEAAEHVGRLLGRYKRPSDLVVIDVLPRNVNGKVLKRDLRARLASASPKGNS